MNVEQVVLMLAFVFLVAAIGKPIGRKVACACKYCRRKHE